MKRQLTSETEEQLFTEQPPWPPCGVPSPRNGWSSPTRCTMNKTSVLLVPTFCPRLGPDCSAPAVTFDISYKWLHIRNSWQQKSHAGWSVGGNSLVIPRDQLDERVGQLNAGGGVYNGAAGHTKPLRSVCLGAKPRCKIRQHLGGTAPVGVAGEIGGDNSVLSVPAPCKGFSSAGDLMSHTSSRHGGFSCDAMSVSNHT